MTTKPKMPTAHITFYDFMSLPVIFYHTLGINPYESVTNKETSSRWLLAVFLFQVINLNITFVLEWCFVYISYKNSENFVESCMVMGYIVFVIVGELKMLTVWWQKSQLNELMIEMELIFPPSDPEKQRHYLVDRYLKRCRFFTKGFACLYLVLIVTYNLFVLVQFLIRRFVLHSPTAVMAMPYTSVSPWSLDSKLGFCLMYTLQAIAGYTCTAGHASSDILIYAVLIQAIMHYDYLSRELTGLQIQAGRVRDGYEQDLKILQQLIAYHNKLLGSVGSIINSF